MIAGYRSQLCLEHLGLSHLHDLVRVLQRHTSHKEHIAWRRSRWLAPFLVRPSKGPLFPHPRPPGCSRSGALADQTLVRDRAKVASP